MNRNLLAFAMFTAGGIVLPAGDYNVQSMDPWGGPTLSVHNMNDPCLGKPRHRPFGISHEVTYSSS